MEKKIEFNKHLISNNYNKKYPKWGEEIDVIVPQADGTYKVMRVRATEIKEPTDHNDIEGAVAEVCMRKMGV